MIHKTAVIDPAAKIGADVEIGPFAVIEADTEIGDGCVIGPHAVILRYTALGARCAVHSCAVLGDLPQDLAFKDAVSGVRVGNDCRFREGVTIHRGTKPDTFTEVGDNCYMMANSHLAHNVRLGKGVILANGALLGGYVEVGDRCFISGNVLIHQFVRIGRLAMMGGASGVSKDVPPFCTVKPMTTNRVMGLNVVGMKRAGLDPAARLDVKQAFSTIYRSGLNVTQAVEKLKEGGTAAGLEYAAFIEGSKRGICGFKEEEEEE